MGAVLSILDFVVVLAVVISVPRAVWSGQSQGSRFLSVLILLVMLVFGLVSLSAAYGLAHSSSLIA